MDFNLARMFRPGCSTYPYQHSYCEINYFAHHGARKIRRLPRNVSSTQDCISVSHEKLLPHDFIAKQQAGYLQYLRSNLEPGMVLVVADFAENYSFVVQDAAQSFHWNNLQATIHPFVCYYRRDMQDEAFEHTSFVIISECNIHDTVAVHLFQKMLIQFLSDKLGHLNKIATSRMVALPNIRIGKIS